MADEAEILNLAVDASQRRQGIGSRLVEEAIAECKAAGVRTIFLEVRESNEAARRLYARADLPKADGAANIIESLPKMLWSCNVQLNRYWKSSCDVSSAMLIFGQM